MRFNQTARVVGAEHMSPEEIVAAVQQGGKFVSFTWALSVCVLSLKFPTDIYFVRPGESAVMKGLPFAMISLVAGWWGFPFGPVYTIMALVEDFGGGRDRTREVLASMGVDVVPSAYQR